MYFRKYTMIYELFFAWQSYKYTVYNGFLCLSSSITHREQQTLYKIVKENICLSFWIYENCYVSISIAILSRSDSYFICSVPIFFTPLTVHSIWIKYPYRNKYTYVYVQLYMPYLHPLWLKIRIYKFSLYQLITNGFSFFVH